MPSNNIPTTQPPKREAPSYIRWDSVPNFTALNFEDNSFTDHVDLREEVMYRSKFRTVYARKDIWGRSAVSRLCNPDNWCPKPIRGPATPYAKGYHDCIQNHDFPPMDTILDRAFYQKGVIQAMIDIELGLVKKASDKEKEIRPLYWGMMNPTQTATNSVTLNTNGPVSTRAGYRASQDVGSIVWHNHEDEGEVPVVENGQVNIPPGTHLDSIDLTGTGEPRITRRVDGTGRLCWTISNAPEPTPNRAQLLNPKQSSGFDWSGNTSL